MDRRTFLKWVSFGWLASSLPVALTACNSRMAWLKQATNQSSAKAAFQVNSQDDGFIEIGTVQDLEKTGRLLQKKLSGNSVLVVRDPVTPDTLYAFEPVCTHQGCQVDWRSNEQNIFCPCHGSTFYPDGTVLRGPASRPLKRYKVKVKENTVLVKVI